MKSFAIALVLAVAFAAIGNAKIPNPLVIKTLLKSLDLPENLLDPNGDSCPACQKGSRLFQNSCISFSFVSAVNSITIAGFDKIKSDQFHLVSLHFR